MNADKYRKLCNQASAFSRRDLEITEKTLRERNHSVALQVSEILQNSPIAKPEKHRGEMLTDCFWVTLSESETELIIDVFIDLEAENIKNDGITTSLASLYAGV